MSILAEQHRSIITCNIETIFTYNFNVKFIFFKKYVSRIPVTYIDY